MCWLRRVDWRVVSVVEGGLLLAVVGLGLVWILASTGHSANPSLAPICAAERQACEEAERQYEKLRDRDKEHCQVCLDQRDATIAALEERVKPCCPLGCERELLYKDYLFTAQRTYYKKHLKKVCGVHRPPEPTENELKPLMGLSEEELEALED